MILKWYINFGELSINTDFVNDCVDLNQNLRAIQKVIDQLTPLKSQYDKMSLESKIEYDLFLVFAMNSLYWIQLRLQGVDPSKHPVKDELRRIQATMLKWQQVKDRNLRPKMDIEAAKRFVRNGLYDHKDTNEVTNKKKKFNE